MGRKKVAGIKRGLKDANRATIRELVSKASKTVPGDELDDLRYGSCYNFR